MSFRNVVLPVSISVMRLVLLSLVREAGDHKYENFSVPPESKFYDFIIVGSGSAGAVVAARLSEEYSWNVLLLEAGGVPTPESYVPGLDILLYLNQVDWGYKTAPQKYAMFGYEGRSNIYPRGRALGGSSTTNYMMYVRGNKHDFDNWAKLGNPGWDYETVLRYYKKSENFKGYHSRKDGDFHGFDGPMVVSNKKWGTAIGQTFLEAGIELGYNTIDPNAEHQTGFSVPDLTIDNGIRQSTAEAFLRPNLHRKNLDVLPNAHVTKIIFDEHNRAIGVKYLIKGKEKVALAKREVILSAGAVDSPKILMLSGVGPKEHLQDKDIKVIHDLPGVGQNFHDHPVIFGLCWTVKSGSALSVHTFTNPHNILRYFKTRTGPYSVPFGVEGNAWIPLGNGTPSDWADTQYLMFSVTPAFDGGLLFQTLIGYNRELFEKYFASAFGHEGFCIGPTLVRPKSRGSITLKNKNPMEQAIIDPNFLSHPDDVALMVKAIKFARQIGDSKVMKTRIGAKFHDTPLPGCHYYTPDSDDYLACYARFFSSTIYHPAGSCKMAPYHDKMGVVDHRLRVRGVKGLRVIDASIMPVVVNGNTNAASVMIGERGADLVIEDWKKNYV